MQCHCNLVLKLIVILVAHPLKLQRFIAFGRPIARVFFQRLSASEYSRLDSEVGEEKVCRSVERGGYQSAVLRHFRRRVGESLAHLDFHASWQRLSEKPKSAEL